MKKEFQNDFKKIQHKRRRRRFIIRLVLLTLALAALVFGSVRFVFYSDFFKFNNVIFTVENGFDKEKVLNFLENKIKNESFLARSLGPKNFLAWPKTILGKDLPSFPEIEKLEIEKNYKENTLLINAVVQEPLGIWCLKKIAEPKCFWFSEHGKIFKESPMPSGNLIKVVSDYSQADLSLGGKVLDEYLLNNFISVFKVAIKADINVAEIILDKLEDEEITVKTANGPEIYFGLRHSAESYLPVINSLAKNPKFKTFEYIDLRTENRVYLR